MIRSKEIGRKGTRGNERKGKQGKLDKVNVKERRTDQRRKGKQSGGKDGKGGN